MEKMLRKQGAIPWSEDQRNDLRVCLQQSSMKDEARTMSSREKIRTKTVGLPPGSLVHVGQKTGEQIHLNLLSYEPEGILEKDLQKIEESFPYLHQEGLDWISVRGLHKPEIISALGDHLGLHLLLQEDVLNTTQRPKVN